MEVRERIALAAERLIAERGPGVPLRDIAVEAGQRNNSAVHYHFGSRDALIRSVVDRRVELLEKHQVELLNEYEANHTGDEVRGLVDVLVRPMFHVPYVEGSTHYGRFLEQVRNHAVIADALDVDHWPTVRMITARLGKALKHLPGPTRRRRIGSMSTVLFALLADEERRCEESGTTMPSNVQGMNEVTDMITGLLTADSAAPPRR